MKKTCDGPQLIIERSSFNRLYTIWDNFVKLHSKLQLFSSSSDFHRFMEDLTPVVANWNGNSHIVDIMDADKFISLYKEYVGHHAEQLQALETAKNSQAFLLWLLVCTRNVYNTQLHKDVEAQGKVELKALLERPLRRISEYYLVTQVTFMLKFYSNLPGTDALQQQETGSLRTSASHCDKALPSN